jgi:cyclopropane fatty-acyl-phospholipid synthase-like methyltransferase
MMKSDQQRWNVKYSRSDAKAAPCEAVEKFCSLAPRVGCALDLAAGLGGNSLFLADQGFAVDAVDISDVALQRLSDRHHPRITTICADLDHFDIAPQRYDLIVDVHFLNRRLFPLIQEGLTPGGIVIFETFVEVDRCDAEESEEPTCRDYLLRPNELLHAFLPLRILFYQERQNIPPTRASHTATLVACRR